MRIAQSLVLGMALGLCGAAAHAMLMSTGADGPFQPTASVVLDPTRQVFNFTDIFIPMGVTVSFGGLSSSQPVELLATRNIDIAGVLDAGTNSLLIETPGTTWLAGMLTTRGGTLTLVSGTLGAGAGSVIGIAGGTPPAANCPGHPATGAAGALSIGGAGPALLAAPLPSPCLVLPVGNGVALPGEITLLDPLLPSTVPEPGTLALLALGLVAMGRGRRHHAAAGRQPAVA